MNVAHLKKQLWEYAENPKIKNRYILLATWGGRKKSQKLHKEIKQEALGHSKASSSGIALDCTLHKLYIKTEG